MYYKLGSLAVADSVEQEALDFLHKNNVSIWVKIDHIALIDTNKHGVQTQITYKIKIKHKKETTLKTRVDHIMNLSHYMVDLNKEVHERSLLYTIVKYAHNADFDAPGDYTISHYIYEAFMVTLGEENYQELLNILHI